MYKILASIKSNVISEKDTQGKLIEYFANYTNSGDVNDGVKEDYTLFNSYGNKYCVFKLYYLDPESVSTLYFH